MSTPLNLKDIEYFMKIVDAGSLSRASELNKIPKSSISKSLRRLEDTLGVELFNRLSHRMILNESGKQFLTHCQKITSVCDDTLAAMQQTSEQPQGILKLATESEFGTTILGPLVQNCMRRFPLLKYDISIIFDNPEFPEELDLDCLIYVGTPRDSQLVGKLLGKYTYGMFASANYIQKHGRPGSIIELESHIGIQRLKHGQLEQWKLHNHSHSKDISLQSNISVNSYWMAKFFAMDGAGIGYLPKFFVQSEIDNGTLIPILKQWKSAPIPVYALYAKQRYKSPKLKTFIDSCKEGFFLLNT
jgi:DNA-binding transcriptional LysR family regulator